MGPNLFGFHLAFYYDYASNQNKLFTYKIDGLHKPRIQSRISILTIDSKHKGRDGKIFPSRPVYKQKLFLHRRTYILHLQLHRCYALEVVLLNRITYIYGRSAFDIRIMFVHAESDTAHRYRRLALADFEFQMFLITSHQTGTGIDNFLASKIPGFIFPGPTGLNCFNQ